MGIGNGRASASFKICRIREILCTSDLPSCKEPYRKLEIEFMRWGYKNRGSFCWQNTLYDQCIDQAFAVLIIPQKLSKAGCGLYLHISSKIGSYIIICERLSRESLITILLSRTQRCKTDSMLHTCTLAHSLNSFNKLNGWTNKSNSINKSYTTDLRITAKCNCTLKSNSQITC